MSGLPVAIFLVLLVLLILLTFRRNVHITHREPAGYGIDFRGVLERSQSVMDDLRQALRDREERPLAHAASAARSTVHASISELDRLGLPDALGEAEQERLDDLRVRLRKAMESYEWAARIAETTEVLDNPSLLKAIETLVSAGDQACAQVRFDLVSIPRGLQRA